MPPGYTPTVWTPGVTPLSALNMNNLEKQYEEILKLFNAQTILIATADDTPIPLTVGASTIVARLAAGNIVAATPAQILALLSGQAGADFNMNAKRIANVLAPNAAGCVLIKGTRGTLLELPVLTTGKIWQGVGGIPAEVTPGPLYAEGTFAGDGAPDRAIAHGLGKVPIWVAIWNLTDKEYNLIFKDNGIHLEDNVFGDGAVTAWDATNFHTGFSGANDYGNTTGRNYEWIALG